MTTITEASAPSPSSELLSEKKGAVAPLTPSQIAIVKSTAPLLKEHGVEITTLMYNSMLSAHPELNNIFNRTSQATGAQPRALAAAVLAYASYVDNLAVLKAAVERIAHKHVSLTVQPEHYAIVGKYLIAAVATVLGDAVTAEVAEAWVAAYAVLAEVLINLEQEIYTAHENWQGWRRFKIQRRVVESAEITSFHLVPEDGKPLPLYKPGQYLSLRIPIAELGHMQARQYSLSDRPRSEYYRISVKREPGKKAGLPGLVSNILHAEYQEGDTVEVTHPTGEFFVDPAALDKDVPLVLISAGVGVTPMVSILNTTLAAGPGRSVSWIHGARNGDVQAFGEHIRNTVQANPKVTATIFRSRHEAGGVKGEDYHFDGRIDLGRLDRRTHLFADDKAAEYFVCGPPSFMEDIRCYLAGVGVDAERIHSEIFGTGDGE